MHTNCVCISHWSGIVITCTLHVDRSYTYRAFWCWFSISISVSISFQLMKKKVDSKCTAKKSFVCGRRKNRSDQQHRNQQKHHKHIEIFVCIICFFIWAISFFLFPPVAFFGLFLFGSHRSKRQKPMQMDIPWKKMIF